MSVVALQMQRIDWLGMRLSIPTEWEMLRHSVREERGRLMFADRRYQRLLVTWGACGARPDTTRMFQDYRTRDENDHSEVELSDVPFLFGWEGYRRVLRNERVTRVGRFSAALQRWIEFTLSWPEEFDTELEGSVLNGFSVSDIAGTAVSWRAFGFGVEMPRSWKLYQMSVSPADIQVTFREGGAEFSVRRQGMLEGWYDGDLENYLRSHSKGTRKNYIDERVSGHRCARCESLEAGKRWQGLLGLLRNRKDMAWECLDRNSLFHTVLLSPQRSPVELGSLVIHCHE